MADITISGISKGFDESTKVIKKLNLDIKSGEFIVLLGPSGCGKTTLLRLIAGLYYCDGGTIKIGSKDATKLAASKRGLAMVFQSYALYPHMTVRNNIAFGLKLAKIPKDKIDARVKEVSKVLEIEHLLERKPRALSGGQRQRVAIGRAIARNPVAFLFDEPLSNLDAALRSQMRLELAHLHQRLKTTMVYVTHDQMEAMTLADRIVVMNGGIIEQLGTAMDLYHKPRNLFVASFIGSPKMNVFKVTSSSGNKVTLADGKVKVSVERPMKNEKATRLGIRPEHISPVGSGNADCEGVIDVVELLGNDTYLYVKVDGLGLLNLRVAADNTYKVGDKINLKFLKKHIHLFNTAGQSLIKHK